MRGLDNGKKSVFKRLIIENIIIISLPVMIITAVMCMIVTGNIKTEQRMNTMQYLSKYVLDINSRIESTIQRSEFIFRNDAVVNILTKTDENIMDNYMDSKKMTDMINIFNDSITAKMTIYTDNKNIYRSRYIQYTEEAPERDFIRAIIDENNLGVVWDPDIYKDESKNEHIVFFRNIQTVPGSVMRISIPLYRNKKDYNDIYVAAKGSIAESEHDKIKTNIGENFDVYTYLNKEEMHKKIHYYLMILISMGLCMIALLNFISIKMSRKTTSKITNLLKRLDNDDIFENFDNIRREAYDEYETSIVVDVIKDMADRIESINHDKYIYEMEKRRTSLELLQSKINPHILYNSLAVIQHKAYKSNDMETFDIVDRLVGYYRLVLARGQEFVTVENELDLVEKYVQLNEISNNKSYNLEIIVPEEIRRLKILHLILQPFIENSIIHGLSGTRFNNKITIQCRRKGNLLEFKVSDNGYGMSREMVESLECGEKIGRSYGVANTRERISLIYGDSGSVHFESEPNKGTTVIISVSEIE